MTPEREGRISQVISRRFIDLTVVLENVHDPHNIGAILRTCDAVGVSEIFVVHTDSRLSHSNLRLGKRASAGAHDWVKVHYFNELEECMRVVQSAYGRILAAVPQPESASLFALDLKMPAALLFGNEQTGISRQALGAAHSFSPFLKPE
ncbi:MAG: hypothetical protein IPH16_12560 [Haliscomenobacter sp.]|nr:hypothetical protein [Haliscomenobacter sp.]